VTDRKVLIVDDDPATLRLLAEHLDTAGFDVLQATDGREAMNIVMAEAPPIVITGWAMPEMDGIELCRTLRQHEGVSFVYLIILIAHGNQDCVAEALEAGADDFLAKPISRPELRARLRVAEHITRLEADLSRRTREIHRLNAEMAITTEKLGAANDKLQLMVTQDELTGLLNRREAMSRLHQLWGGQDRYGQVFSCIMLDFDGFKSFNDTYGHAAGDMVLRETSSVLRSEVRSTDLVCRVGGEEFLILCPSVGARGGMVCAEHVREAVERHDFRWEDSRLKVTISLGVAEWRPEMKCPDDILRAADHAMYASKAAGRNRVTVAGNSTMALQA
jgi:two-component system, cell cycle response regulator